MSALSLPPTTNASAKKDDAKDKKKVSCVHCRRIKRKCGGGQPCKNCVKKNVPCEYSQMDRRTQRYSIGYIKSLETNNEVYESTLSNLVLLRNDPDELIAKLEALTTSFPPSERLGDIASDLDEEIRPPNSDDEGTVSPLPAEPYQYFGPGSIYHYSQFLRPDKEPIINTRNLPENRSSAVTLQDDWDYVAGLVHGYFEQQTPDMFKYLFDRDLILAALDAHDLSGPYLDELLIYAICCNCEALTYAQADAYCSLVLDLMFTNTAKSCVAVSQCYTMLAVHTLSKGQMLKGWLLAGLGIRAGLEVGFDIEKDADLPLATNRCFMATILIDTYICMSLGRKPTILPNFLPVLRLRSENDTDYYTLKYCVELVQMTSPMLQATYKPVLYDEDPRVNYLLKFNRSKAFNVKLLKWKLSLEPCCTWQYSLMKASTDLVNENHTLKYFYYYLLLFLNKPFLHVPKQHLTVYIFEEIAKEMLLIVVQKLQKLGEAGFEIPDAGDVAHISNMSLYSEHDMYNGANMDLCVLTLLCHVLVTLITTQPEEYLYLERHFKIFARYLQLKCPRKYKANNNPISRLHGILAAFKKEMKRDALSKLENSSSSSQLHSSPATSEEYSHKQGGSPGRDTDGQRQRSDNNRAPMLTKTHKATAPPEIQEMQFVNTEPTIDLQQGQPSVGTNRLVSGYMANQTNQYDPLSLHQQINMFNMYQDQFSGQINSNLGQPAAQAAAQTALATGVLNVQGNGQQSQPAQMSQMGAVPQMNHLMNQQMNQMNQMPQHFNPHMNGIGQTGFNQEWNPASHFAMGPTGAQLNAADSDQFGIDYRMPAAIDGTNFTYGHSVLDTPYHKMVGTMFSNGGDEFMLEKERVNWDGLFTT